MKTQTANEYAAQCQRYASTLAQASRDAAMRARLDEAAGDFWGNIDNGRKAIGLQTLSRTYYQRARQVMGLED